MTLSECEEVFPSLHICSDLCLDHVDASRAEGFHTVVDIHHTFTLGHVQHDIQHNVAAGASCPRAERQRPALAEKSSQSTALITSSSLEKKATEILSDTARLLEIKKLFTFSVRNILSGVMMKK